ncbi:MAG: hypothetical protein JST42_21510 [Bacteroidetes bacterium]|nr:hypothetical protein [Bacteroidota bacterium]
MPHIQKARRPGSPEHLADQRHTIAAGRLLTIGLRLGWKAMTSLVKFAFKIPGMFARTARRSSAKQNIGGVVLPLLSILLHPPL